MMQVRCPYHVPLQRFRLWQTIQKNALKWVSQSLTGLSPWVLTRETTVCASLYLDWVTPPIAILQGSANNWSLFTNDFVKMTHLAALRRLEREGTWQRSSKSEYHGVDHSFKQTLYANLWVFSRSSISFRRWGSHTCGAYSRCGRIKDL